MIISVYNRIWARIMFLSRIIKIVYRLVTIYLFYGSLSFLCAGQQSRHPGGGHWKSRDGEGRLDKEGCCGHWLRHQSCSRLVTLETVVHSVVCHRKLNATSIEKHHQIQLANQVLLIPKQVQLSMLLSLCQMRASLVESEWWGTSTTHQPKNRQASSPQCLGASDRWRWLCSWR